jgi:hypothetical protein
MVAHKDAQALKIQILYAPESTSALTAACMNAKLIEHTPACKTMFFVSHFFLLLHNTIKFSLQWVLCGRIATNISPTAYKCTFFFPTLDAGDSGSTSVSSAVAFLFFLGVTRACAVDDAEGEALLAAAPGFFVCL